MKVGLFSIITVFIMFGGGLNHSSTQLKPKTILHRADEARGNVEGVKWKLYIHSLEGGRTQERKLNVKAKGYDFLAILTSPPRVKGQKLLMVSHNMWFAKPGLKKSVPISPRQKLVGGASYGDIAATNYADDYEATPLKDEVIDKELCYVYDLKAIAKNATYDRIKYWISKERFVGVKAEYFTVSGKMFKSATFEYGNKVQVRNKPRPFISKMIITDAIVRSNITTMNFNRPSLVKVPASTFDLNLFMMR